jgi:hypothetical protein
VVEINAIESFGTKTILPDKNNNNNGESRSQLDEPTALQELSNSPLSY